jgi:hypothetical protein
MKYFMLLLLLVLMAYVPKDNEPPSLPDVISDWMAQYDTIIGIKRLKDTVIEKKVEQWNKYENENSMLSHIISHDLFNEFYIEQDTFFIMSNTSLSEDTALLNSWIRKGELGKYLKRLK